MSAGQFIVLLCTTTLVLSLPLPEKNESSSNVADMGEPVKRTLCITIGDNGTAEGTQVEGDLPPLIIIKTIGGTSKPTVVKYIPVSGSEFEQSQQEVSQTNSEGARGTLPHYLKHEPSVHLPSTILQPDNESREELTTVQTPTTNETSTLLKIEQINKKVTGANTSTIVNSNTHQDSSSLVVQTANSSSLEKTTSFKTLNTTITNECGNFNTEIEDRNQRARNSNLAMNNGSVFDATVINGSTYDSQSNLTDPTDENDETRNKILLADNNKTSSPGFVAIDSLIQSHNTSNITQNDNGTTLTDNAKHLTLVESNAKFEAGRNRNETISDLYEFSTQRNHVLKNITSKNISTASISSRGSPDVGNETIEVKTPEYKVMNELPKTTTAANVINSDSCSNCTTVEMNTAIYSNRSLPNISIQHNDTLDMQLVNGSDSANDVTNPISTSSFTYHNSSKEILSNNSQIMMNNETPNTSPVMNYSRIPIDTSTTQSEAYNGTEDEITTVLSEISHFTDEKPHNETSENLKEQTVLENNENGTVQYSVTDSQLVATSLKPTELDQKDGTASSTTANNTIETDKNVITTEQSVRATTTSKIEMHALNANMSTSISSFRKNHSELVFDGERLVDVMSVEDDSLSTTDPTTFSISNQDVTSTSFANIAHNRVTETISSLTTKPQSSIDSNTYSDGSVTLSTDKRIDHSKNFDFGGEDSVSQKEEDFILPQSGSTVSTKNNISESTSSNVPTFWDPSPVEPAATRGTPKSDWERFNNFTMVFPFRTSSFSQANYPIMSNSHHPEAFYKRYDPSRGLVYLMNLPPARLRFQ